MSQLPNPETIARVLSALDDMDMSALKKRYVELVGTPPPKRIGRTLLQLAVAYEIQAKSCRPLVNRVHRKLDRLREGKPSRRDVSRQSPSMKPGGRLVREWRGRTYEVYVAEDGVYMNGKRYKSLTAAAYAITGARWNGPRFFGLRSPRLADGVSS